MKAAHSLLGAAATVFIISRQIGSSERQEKGKLARELMASRAVLPLTLSALYDWCSACAKILLDCYGSGKVVISPSGTIPKMPPIPSDAIKGLERLIATSDDKAADAVANLVGNLQVFTARMQGAGFIEQELDVPSRIVFDMEGHIVGIASIAAHIGAMFNYGRRLSHQIPAHATWPKVVEALNLFGADRSIQRKVYAMVDEREKALRQPGYMATDVSGERS